jgi:hypothetical protein
VPHRASFRALGLAFGLFAGGEDLEVARQLAWLSMGARCRRLRDQRRNESRPSFAGSFVLQAGAAREIGGILFRWSAIRQAGAYTVHQSVRLRIRGPTFTVVSKTVASIAEAAEPLATGLGGFVSQALPPTSLDSRLSAGG